MIGLVDYGLGNIQAIANIYRRLDIPVVAASTPEQLTQADRLILPGVGSFDWAMSRLNASGMRDCLDVLVREEKRPVLGICVGMQMLAQRSEEGELPGLGWVDGDVRRFDESVFAAKAQLPHMGWNDAMPRSAGCLFKGIEAPRFYFLHSYYFCPRAAEDILSVTDYGLPFASAVRRGHVFGTQFHPEKSHGWGVSLLRNFAEI